MRSEDDDPCHGAHGIPLRPVAELRCENTPAKSDQLPPLRHALAGWAASTGMRADLVDAVTLATDEAMSNVVNHAYPGARGTFDLHAVHQPEHAGVRVTVRDHGRWRPVPADPGPLHGRGLPLIRALAHGVTIERGPEGTTVSMVWSLLTN